MSSTATWTASQPVPGSAERALTTDVLAGLVGMVAIAAFRLIHQKNPLSPWLLPGLLLTPIGLWLTFR